MRERKDRLQRVENLEAGEESSGLDRESRTATDETTHAEND